jgi:dihydroorotate dehydrogenase
MAEYQVGGITLQTAPIMVGAGVCKSPHTTWDWLAVAPVVSGSYTPLRRDGNEGTRLFYPDTEEELKKLGFGLNSFGMPNMGFAAATTELARYTGEQSLIVSLAGFSIDDYVNGMEQFTPIEGISAIELNFGCPNTEHGKIMSFDPRSLDSLLQRLGKYRDRPIWVKFSPYSDPGLLKEIAAVINASALIIKAVVTCNTFPSAYAGKTAISPMGGLAGLSGAALKPIALGQVIQFRQHLVSEIDVIGVGGITVGNDVIDFLDAGAQAVQMTSLPFWLGSPSLFWNTLLDAHTDNRLETYLT